MKEYHASLAKTAIKTDKFFKATFTRFVVDGPPISHEVTINPSMIVSSHRSHADYFILGTLFHQKGIGNIRFAAGDNLTELPYIGRKFKEWGAFAVARDKSSGKNYVRALCNQVVDMLEEGDNIIVFPESGRSYKGDMMEMRGVILSALVISQSHHMDKKHYMVPVAVSYEQLPELPYFKMLERGKAIRKQKGGFFKQMYGNLLYFGSDLIAFAKFLLANKFGIKYGNVYIDFAQPVTIQDITSVVAAGEPGSKDDLTSQRKAVQAICDYMYKRIITLYRILPMHVVAAILQLKGACAIKQLAEYVPDILERLKKADYNCKSLESLTADEIVKEGIRQLQKMKGVIVRDETIVPREATILAYYAAAIPVPGGETP